MYIWNVLKWKALKWITIMTKPIAASLALMAIGALLLGNLSGVVADVIIKQFSDSAGIYQYLFLRQLTTSIILFPLFIKQPISRRRFENPKLQLFRGNLILIGGACVVVTLNYLPLSTAHVVFYTVPVFTLLLAVWWFKERLQTHRMVNVALCFVGVIVALKPEHLGWGALAGITASLCVAIYNLTTRYMPSHLSSLSILYWATICSIPMLGLIAFWDWHPITQETIYLILGSSLCIGTYQICCVLAYRRAEAGAIAIAEYSGLVFALLLGWWIFGEQIDIGMLAGISLIVLPIIWQTLKEHKGALQAAKSET